METRDYEAPTTRDLRSAPRAPLANALAGREHGMRMRLRRLVVVACLSACGCVRAEESVLHRAALDGHCPMQKISVLSRDDLADDLYDVEACGFRARYRCDADDVPLIGTPAALAGAVTACVRQPDPSVWDPDPATLAVPRTDSEAQRVVRMCGDGLDDDCLYRGDRSWEWRSAQRGSLARP
jgi:hypothetical protein